MVKLIKPLTGFMLLAILMGTLGFLCAQFIPILGGFAALHGLRFELPVSVKTIWILLPVLALVRAVLRYAEQRTNHYIAFTILAIIRDKVFRALRVLCPAKLEGCDKGDLISLITSDVELLEVFYAHTISPICIAFCTQTVMCLFIGSFHWSLGLLALIAYLSVGVVLPLIISKRSGTLGDELRAQSGALAAYMLENIRGLDETIQYDAGDERLRTLTEKTVALSERQGKLNKLTGTNLALANTMILLFDLAMAALAAVLYSFDSLMKNFSFVFQNVYLFEDTVANNIRFGEPEASMERVMEAAKKARCHEFILSLPNGYETVIGEGGASISIARAIMKDAPIIILDEATANVDPENETELTAAIEALTKEKTIIMIAHRLKTVRHADQIFVICNGEISQQGTHEELIGQDGIYKRFVEGRQEAASWKLSTSA